MHISFGIYKGQNQIARFLTLGITIALFALLSIYDYQLGRSLKLAFVSVFALIVVSTIHVELIDTYATWVFQLFSLAASPMFFIMLQRHILSDQRIHIKPLKALAPLALIIIIAAAIRFIPKIKKFSFPLAALVTVIIEAWVIYRYSHLRISMQLLQIVQNVVLYLVLAAFVYLICGKIRPAVAIPMVIMLFLEFLNLFIIQCRDTEIIPTDLLSIRTAMNVAGTYQFEFEIAHIDGILLCLFVMFVYFFCFTIKEEKHCRPAALAILLAGCCFIYATIGEVPAGHWKDDGARKNCFVLNFLKRIDELKIEKPENYNISHLQSLETTFDHIDITQNHQPNIIAIMSESFTDLRVLGKYFTTNKNVMEYYDNMDTNVIKGFAVSSVYGGGTANSEWEFLTGNSMAFLPEGVVTYQTYIKDHEYSLVGYLKQLGYQCVSMHPYHASGWMRTKVYPVFGFDESYFLPDFPQKKMVRDYVSDQEMYEQVIKRYEDKADGEKLFLFGITMQNHGNYRYDGPNFSPTVDLYCGDQEFPSVVQFMSLMDISNRSLDTLINYFQNVDEDTVILFFGDHQPALSATFAAEAHGGELETLDERMLRYKVPFFVWANYDIEERDVEITSINYLSNYLFEVAGLPIPPYSQFLIEAEKAVPALTPMGFYSTEAGGFRPFKKASGRAAEMLNAYHCLQYNTMFDRDNRLSIFSYGMH